MSSAEHPRFPLTVGVSLPHDDADAVLLVVGDHADLSLLSETTRSMLRQTHDLSLEASPFKTIRGSTGQMLLFIRVTGDDTEAYERNLTTNLMAGLTYTADILADSTVWCPVPPDLPSLTAKRYLAILQSTARVVLADAPPSSVRISLPDHTPDDTAEALRMYADLLLKAPPIAPTRAPPPRRPRRPRMLAPRHPTAEAPAPPRAPAPEPPELQTVPATDFPSQPLESRPRTEPAPETPEQDMPAGVHTSANAITKPPRHASTPTTPNSLTPAGQPDPFDGLLEDPLDATLPPLDAPLPLDASAAVPSSSDWDPTDLPDRDAEPPPPLAHGADTELFTDDDFAEDTPLPLDPPALSLPHPTLSPFDEDSFTDEDFENHDPLTQGVADRSQSRDEPAEETPADEEAARPEVEQADPPTGPAIIAIPPMTDDDAPANPEALPFAFTSLDLQESEPEDAGADVGDDGSADAVVHESPTTAEDDTLLEVPPDEADSLEPDSQADEGLDRSVAPDSLPDPSATTTDAPADDPAVDSSTPDAVLAQEALPDSTPETPGGDESTPAASATSDEPAADAPASPDTVEALHEGTTEPADIEEVDAPTIEPSPVDAAETTTSTHADAAVLEAKTPVDVGVSPPERPTDGSDEPAPVRAAEQTDDAPVAEDPTTESSMPSSDATPLGSEPPWSIRATVPDASRALDHIHQTSLIEKAALLLQHQLSEQEWQLASPDRDAPTRGHGFDLLLTNDAGQSIGVDIRLCRHLDDAEIAEWLAELAPRPSLASHSGYLLIVPGSVEPKRHAAFDRACHELGLGIFSQQLTGDFYVWSGQDVDVALAELPTPPRTEVNAQHSHEDVDDPGIQELGDLLISPELSTPITFGILGSEATTTSTLIQQLARSCRHRTAEPQAKTETLTITIDATRTVHAVPWLGVMLETLDAVASSVSPPDPPAATVDGWLQAWSSLDPVLGPTRRKLAYARRLRDGAVRQVGELTRQLERAQGQLVELRAKRPLECLDAAQRQALQRQQQQFEDVAALLKLPEGQAIRYDTVGVIERLKLPSGRAQAVISSLARTTDRALSHVLLVGLIAVTVPLYVGSVLVPTLNPFLTSWTHGTLLPLMFLTAAISYWLRHNLNFVIHHLDELHEVLRKLDNFVDMGRTKQRDEILIATDQVHDLERQLLEANQEVTHANRAVRQAVQEHESDTIRGRLASMATTAQHGGATLHPRPWCLLRQDLSDTLHAWAAAPTAYRPRRIIVLVDHLDRCDPHTVSTTLEALRELFSCAPAALVIAGHPQHLSAALSAAAPPGQSGAQHLRRLIQVPVGVSPDATDIWDNLDAS